MTDSRAINFDSMCKLVCDIQKFHGQEVYKKIGPAIAQKKPYFRIIFGIIRKNSRFKVVNFLMLFTVLVVGYRIFRYPKKGCRVFQYGISRNNIAAFERLNSCLIESGVSDISMNYRGASLRAKMFTAFSIPTMWRAANALTHKRHENPLAHLQSIIGCAALLLYCRHPFPSEVEVVCVASDHSPISQAILFLAKLEGRRTCYIQHAPVTSHFPPLIHDLSILHDRASVMEYEGSAKRYGSTLGNSNIVILPPFDEPFKMPKLEVTLYSVGICLSFLPNIDVISMLLDDLSRSPHIRTVFLRPHPRCRLDLSSFFGIAKVMPQPERFSASEFFKVVDFVLVPNSGVAIEALHSGCPTFFTPMADDLPDDYYGFVARGILPVFNADYLGSPDQMIAFFDHLWMRRFGNYDETVNSSLEEAKGRVIKSFMKLMTQNDRPAGR